VRTKRLGRAESDIKIAVERCLLRNVIPLTVSCLAPRHKSHAKTAERRTAWFSGAHIALPPGATFCCMERRSML